MPKVNYSITVQEPKRREMDFEVSSTFTLVSRVEADYTLVSTTPIYVGLTPLLPIEAIVVSSASPVSVSFVDSATDVAYATLHGKQVCFSPSEIASGSFNSLKLETDGDEAVIVKIGIFGN